MASAAWEVLDVSVEHANPWFQVWRRQVRLPDGSLIRYFSAQYDRSAVGVLALNAGKALLVRQYRVLIDREVWAIPAGGVDVGETSLAAAGRELLEETGHAALALRPLIAFYPTYGSSNQLFEIFLAERTERRCEQIDGNEVLETGWFDGGEVMEMIARNEIPDSLSLVPLLLAMRQGLLAEAERWHRIR
ncbi:hypothetical protein QR66_05010 [Chromobacterium piscinae]|nr:hypothetical protein QR66_05010 [Chromobacterium piscinae]